MCGRPAVAPVAVAVLRFDDRVHAEAERDRVGERGSIGQRSVRRPDLVERGRLRLDAGRGVLVLVGVSAPLRRDAREQQQVDRVVVGGEGEVVGIKIPPPTIRAAPQTSTWSAAVTARGCTDSIGTQSALGCKYPRRARRARLTRPSATSQGLARTSFGSPTSRSCAAGKASSLRGAGADVALVHNSDAGSEYTLNANRVTGTNPCPRRTRSGSVRLGRGFRRVGRVHFRRRGRRLGRGRGG
jgi:hypothetical protein